MATRVAGFEQISSLNTVKTLTVPAGAREAVIHAVTQNVRYRLDGTNPDATTGGLIIASGAPLKLTIDGGMHAAKFIEVTTSAVLNVHYYN